MSSKAVRDAMNAELASWAAAESVVFYDTLNTVPPATSSDWVTYAIGPADLEQLDFSGRNWKETATILAIIWVQAGTGGLEAARLAGSLQTHFNLLQTMPGGISVISAGSPEEINPDGAPHGSQYGLGCSITLERYYTEGA